MSYPTDPDLIYLRECLAVSPFAPVDWDGEDENLRAFQSKAALISWFCQPPGVEGQPYRDRGFYCRELAYLSRTVRPRRVVEFGTSLGIGTCLLRWLNPTADLVTVDISAETFLPGDKRVEIGYLAKKQCIRAKYAQTEACKFACSDVDLCFIDADHSYEAVAADSERAWLNKSEGRSWAIAWHDHNDRHPGVLRAVAEFCFSKNVTLQFSPDSDTVWVGGVR